MFQTEVEFTSRRATWTTRVRCTATASCAWPPRRRDPAAEGPAVQQNPAYLTIIVLARVITRLGSVPSINTKVVEGLFASDLSHLQALYERLNGDDADVSPFGDDPTRWTTSMPSSAPTRGGIDR